MSREDNRGGLGASGSDGNWQGAKLREGCVLEKFGFVYANPI
jgi:hypothetical protein